MTHNPRPSGRSFVGMMAMILGLIGYAFLAGAIGGMMTEWPLAIQTIYYMIAGILWIFPARRILYWMAGKKLPKRGQ